MRLWNRLQSWSRALLRRPVTESEMDAELSFHIASYAEDLIRQGMPRAEAMRRARLEFGGIENTKEECRDARGVNAIESILQDLRFGLRMLRKKPAFTAVAVITLALGIGANAGVFSIVNGILLNPLPYPHPEQLVAIHESKPNFPEGSISVPNFKDWKRNNRSFSKMAISRGYGVSLAGDGESERLQARLVTSDFLSVLGMAPKLGRDFAPGEDEIGAAPVAIISDSLWRRKFGGLPSVVGRRIMLDERGYTVIGVAPPNADKLPGSFQGTDIYIPVGQWDTDAIRSRGAGLSFHGIGRLKPGVTIEQARADMASVTHALALEYPLDDKGIGAALVPLRDEMFGGIRPALLMLSAAVIFVLLIACVNVGNLLMARGGDRAREIAVRSALGAGSRRLIRQLLTETILLALLGGLLGLALAWWSTRASSMILADTLPGGSGIGVNYKVVAFTFLIAAATGVLFGLAPAIKLLHSGMQGKLKDGGRGSTRSSQNTQNIFVMAELAMALVLLSGTGLMLRSLWALQDVNPGFQPEGASRFAVSLPSPMAKGSPEAVRSRLREIRQQFAGTPGITAVALSWGAFPMRGDDETLFWLKGKPRPASESEMNWALRYAVGSDYLKAMGIALHRGRFFNDRDDNHSPLVAVIDEEFAHKFFNNRNPLGKRLELYGNPAHEAEIVGVVAHVKQWGLDTDDKEQLRAQLYLSILQQQDEAILNMARGVDVIVRSALPPSLTFEALRRTSSRMDREQTVFGMQTMDEVVARTMETRRLLVALLSVFAAIALLLATVGIYGVTSYTVGQRTNEIGIRMALGATRGQILRSVLGGGMLRALLGIAMGVAAAFGLTRLLSGMLFGVSPYDPITLGSVAVLLGVVAGVACWIPARRAMRVDPMTALRYE